MEICQFEMKDPGRKCFKINAVIDINRELNPVFLYRPTCLSQSPVHYTGRPSFFKSMI